MPSLDLSNLAAINYYKKISLPPVTSQSSNQPVSSSPASTCSPSSCTPGLQLCVEQGATLSSQITLKVKDVSGNMQPLNITGFNFQFTAKTDIDLPDSNPSVVEVDWTETSTPTQGLTWLAIPSNITTSMQTVPYFYQLRMIQSPTSPSPIVTPLFSGTLNVVQPVSPRI